MFQSRRDVRRLRDILGPAPGLLLDAGPELGQGRTVRLRRVQRGLRPHGFDQFAGYAVKKILALTLKKDHLVQNPREGLIDPPHLKRAKRVNVDFPAWMVEAMDQEADRIGITRQAFIKAERLGSLTQQASTLRQLALAGFMPGLFVTLPLTSLPPMT